MKTKWFLLLVIANIVSLTYLLHQYTEITEPSNKAHKKSKKITTSTTIITEKGHQCVSKFIDRKVGYFKKSVIMEASWITDKSRISYTLHAPFSEQETFLIVLLVWMRMATLRSMIIAGEWVRSNIFILVCTVDVQ